jgi:hypothetical protein
MYRLRTRRQTANLSIVWEYWLGRIEIRADGVALPCVPSDRFAGIDQGAVIEHKGLGHVLQVARALQAQHDDRRAAGSPSRTNRGVPVERDRPNPAQRSSASSHLKTSMLC